MLSPGTNLLAALACYFTLACGASPAPSEAEAIGGTSAETNPCGDQPCADKTGQTIPGSNRSSEEGIEASPSGSLTVSMQKDGQIMVNHKVVEEEELDRIFLENFTRDPDTQVVLSADSGVSHALVVSVMDRAKKAGLSRLAISTTPNTPVE